LYCLSCLLPSLITKDNRSLIWEFPTRAQQSSHSEGLHFYFAIQF
jgi:hypothetical protein